MVQGDPISTRDLFAGKRAASFETDITAFNTGGITSAYQLTAMYNVVTISVADGDSVKLPVGCIAGTVVWIHNADAAQEIDVFPNDGADLGDGANTAVRLVEGHAIAYLATVTNTTWMPMLWL